MRLVLALCCAAHAFVGPHRSAPPRLQATAQEISAKTEGTETIFSLEEVQKILPHRYPFALVDKVIEYEAGKSAVGVKWKRPVVPGDTLVMEVEITNWKAKFGIAKATGRAYVDGNLAVEVGQMTFALAK